MEHAQCLARTAERKASAQRGHLLRRLQTIEMKSERLRVSVLEAEKKVQHSDAATKKVYLFLHLFLISFSYMTVASVSKTSCSRSGRVA